MDPAEAVTKSPSRASKKEQSNSKQVEKSQSTINHENTDLCVDNGHSNGGEKLSCTISNIDKDNANHADKIAKIKKIKTVTIRYQFSLQYQIYSSHHHVLNVIDFTFQNLKSIEKLREMKGSGKELDTNQLKKINREDELLQELKSLQL